MSRRQFLLYGGLCVAAVAVPAILSVSARRAPQPQPNQPDSDHYERAENFRNLFVGARAGRRFAHPYFTPKNKMLAEFEPAELRAAMTKLRERYPTLDESSIRKVTHQHEFDALEGVSADDFEKFKAYEQAALADMSEYCGVKVSDLRLKVFCPDTIIEPSSAELCDYLAVGNAYDAYTFEIMTYGKIVKEKLSSSIGARPIAEFKFDRGPEGTTFGVTYGPILAKFAAKERGHVYTLSTPVVEALHRRIVNSRCRAVAKRLDYEFKSKNLRNQDFARRMNEILGEELAIDEAVAHTTEFRWAEDYCARHPELGFNQNDVALYTKSLSIPAGKYRFVGQLHEMTPQGKVRELVQRYLQDPSDVAKMLGTNWAR